MADIKWQDHPFEVKVKAGDKKSFCLCGKTQSAPFCDGSHKGTEFGPERLSFDKDQTLWICGCGHSKNGIYCDGSHHNL